MDLLQDKRTFNFGPGHCFKLVPKLFQVSRDGRPIHLDPIEIRVLYVLITNPDRVVSREELEKEVWEQDAFGRSQSLNNTIYALRRKLGENTIKTKPKAGYLFAFPVEVEGEVAEPQRKSVSSDKKIEATWPKDLVDRTYFPYRDKAVSSLDHAEALEWLADRYECPLFTLGPRLVPATILWQNSKRVISPNDVLGEQPVEPVVESSSTPLLPAGDYAAARQFIKHEFEKGRIKYEGINYCVRDMDLSRGIPKIRGCYGRYYDNILTQYAMEWELKKALHENSGKTPKENQLPLRTFVEKVVSNPLISGAGRCAAITISMLVVFNRPDGAGFYFLICRRSPEVGVSAGILHVVPAGMFEAFNLGEDWRVDWNLWRELLEEVYNEPKAHEITKPMLSDNLLTTTPITGLRALIADGRAELSVTGLCCDLLNLRTEICSVLFIPEVQFSEAREMEINWEWNPTATKGGFARPWRDIDGIIENELAQERIVASGAVCLGLGRKWVRERHGL